MDISCHARDVNSSGTLSRHERHRGLRPQVLLAHRQPVVLEGLRLIAERAGFQVIGVAEGSSALVSANESLAPDLIVLESGMSDRAGDELALAIRRRKLRLTVLFLGAPADEGLREAISSGTGVADVVSKSASVTELGHAMRQTFEKRAVAGNRVRTLDFAQTAPSASPGHPKLTPRQLEVLRLIAEGKTAKQVAALLDISPRTAEFHKSRVMETLKLRSTAELTRYAIEHNIYEVRLPAAELRQASGGSQA